MINGVDMLITVLCFVLLFLLIDGWDRYNNWHEWNRDRRRKRKHFRYEFKDKLDEKQYRQNLRFSFSFKNITTAFEHLTTAANEASKSFENFNKAFQKLAISQKKHST